MPRLALVGATFAVDDGDALCVRSPATRDGVASAIRAVDTVCGRRYATTIGETVRVALDFTGAWWFDAAGWRVG